MLNLAKLLDYSKAWIAAGGVGLSQWQFDLTEAGQIIVTPPADMVDLIVKMASVGGAVWAFKNRMKIAN